MLFLCNKFDTKQDKLFLDQDRCCDWRYAVGQQVHTSRRPSMRFCNIVRMYGAAVNNWVVAATDVAADPVTGNVFITGTRYFHRFFRCAYLTLCVLL